MNFCTNCGEKLLPDTKFCSNCGNKVLIENNTTNKIDKNIDKVLGSINKLSNEVGNSEYINKSIAATSRTASSTFNWIVKVLAIISLLILFGQFISYALFGKNIHLIEEYDNLFIHSYYNRFERFFLFIARILPSTIFPLILMYLYGKKVKWINYFLGASIFLLIATSIYRKQNKDVGIDNLTIQSNPEQNISNTKENINYNQTNENIELEHYNNDFEENKNSIIQGDFILNKSNYKYKFDCINDTNGETSLNIFKDDELIISKEYYPYHCSIYNIEFKEEYFCFEIHTAGGNSGEEYYTYHVLDLTNSMEYELDRVFVVGFPEEYKLWGLEEVEDDLDVYKIFKEKLKKKIPDLK